MSPEQIAPVTLEHSFRATPEEVFDAWTNPEVLLRWWALGPTWTTPGCEVDLRVGGRYQLETIDDKGELFAVAGEYREIERPRRLVYTWCWQNGYGMHPGHVSVVAVDFVADGDRTIVRLEHSDLASEGSRQGHTAGWLAVLDSLARQIFNEDTDHNTRGRSQR